MMQIRYFWLATMFDAEKCKERFVFTTRRADAIEALRRAAQALELVVGTYEPCEVHVQLVTPAEVLAMGDPVDSMLPPLT